MNKPNILLILTDQWRGDFLGSLGHKAKTPFLDELAGEGFTFTNAYSASPSCIAARACVLTGKKPATCNRIGYLDGIPWKYKDTMIDCLNDDGYQTINVGKTHFYPRKNNCGFEINKLYDPQNWLDNELSDYHQWLKEETNGNVEDTADVINNNGFCYIPWTHPNYLHPTEWTYRESIRQLKGRDQNKPFFIQIGFHRPHPPLDPPTEYFNMYKDIVFDEAKIGDWESDEFRKPTSNNSPMMGVKSEVDRQDAIRAYCGHLTHIDHQIGKIMFYLAKHEPNTIIIFTSDHGDLLGDHCAWRKIYAYEGSSKIPMIIKTPDTSQVTINKVHEYRRNDTVMTHMDIMPTVLTLANIKVPKKVEGLNFAPALYGKKISNREYIHGEHTGGDFINVQFITDGKYKYCYDPLNGIELFFDLINDPNELHNGLKDKKYKEKVDLFKNRLIKELEPRVKEGFVKEGKLQKGVKLAPIRNGLIENIDENELHKNARNQIRRLKEEGLL